MAENKDRRHFLRSAMLGVAAGGMTVPSLLSAQTVAEPWLEGLHGKHKQFFDVGGLNDGKPLRRTDNFLASYHNAYNLPESDICVLFGAHGDGLPFVCSDALWSRFKLGESHNVRDPATNVFAVRNVFALNGVVGTPLSPGQSVTGLAKRGVRFLACMNTINTLAMRFSAQGQGTVAAIREEIVNGLLPGVMTVPAMLIACNRAQESGFTYSWLAG